MTRLLALLWALVARKRDDVDDVVDLVPADCVLCGYPLGYCCCVDADLSDYAEHVAAVMRKCRGCGIKTSFLAGDIYPDTYDGPGDPMCLACQALLSEPVTR